MFVDYGNKRNSGMTGNGSQNSSTTFYGKVIDVILDKFHPKYPKYGKSSSINGVIYRPIGLDVAELEEDVEATEDTFFAYCLPDTLQRSPIRGEIVTLTSAPPYNRDNSSKVPKVYWYSIVGIWNHVNHNSTFEENDFGNYFESNEVNPLQFYPGDVILQGRHGNTVRLGGTKYDSNNITEDSSNGKPFIIVRAGQAESDNTIDNVVEDINKDKTSIQILTDHKTDLEPSNEKRQALDSSPDDANNYKGAQIVINTDRIYLNARDESAFISAKDIIAFNSDKVGIDGEKYVGIDAKKIYLGESAFDEKEPALKGQTSTDWLEDLTGLLEGLATTLALSPPAPPTYIAALVKEGIKLQIQLPKLKSLLKELHSKKVYIDNK